ncbi:putative DNA helicase chromatin remodeling SNF2 family [Medicago truncatula]|uniref:Putative DNA helicase chromatin remodeling SNF2 family n=1 Tax=Medicago truncatula TaxID=3880 RepID=A0A396GWZ1_MEDTR|nr:putative DNA helicase chromatin remodeling SNF2 family [Medicago truncatula]
MKTKVKVQWHRRYCLSRDTKKNEYESNDSDLMLDHFKTENDDSITKSTYKLEGKIAKMLYPHQREGLKWLWSLHCQGKGGILADDMGLGKTMQVRKEIII